MNPNCKAYEMYGAKGITVCEEWDDFRAFRDWAYAAGYRDDLTIERKANTRSYTPDNCTWIPFSKQAANRSIVLRAPTGEAWCEIAKRHGISVRLMHSRLGQGWPIERAATAPRERTSLHLP